MWSGAALSSVVMIVGLGDMHRAVNADGDGATEMLCGEVICSLADGVIILFMNGEVMV